MDAFFLDLSNVEVVRGNPFGWFSLIEIAISDLRCNYFLVSVFTDFSPNFTIFCRT